MTPVLVMFRYIVNISIYRFDIHISNHIGRLNVDFFQNIYYRLARVSFLKSSFTLLDSNNREIVISDTELAFMDHN